MHAKVKRSEELELLKEKEIGNFKSEMNNKISLMKIENKQTEEKILKKKEIEIFDFKLKNSVIKLLFI